MQEHDRAAGEDDDRNIAELLLDQIEFADVILLNKRDLVTDEAQRQLILATVQGLNPSAKIEFTTKCEVRAPLQQAYAADACCLSNIHWRVQALMFTSGFVIKSYCKLQSGMPAHTHAHCCCNLHKSRALGHLPYASW